MGDQERSPVVHSLQGIKKKGWQRRESGERSDRSELGSVHPGSDLFKGVL